MFISKIEISNFRLFGADSVFSIADFNIPDGDTPGSGINVFVGENGSGKTTLLKSIYNQMNWNTKVYEEIDAKVIVFLSMM